MLPFLGSRGFLFSSFGCSCERIGSPPLFKGALPYWNAAPNRDSMVCALQLSTTHTHAFQFLPSTMPCIARLKKPCYCVCKSCMLWCLGLHVWHHNIPIGIPSTGLKSVMVSWCRCTHELLHACLHMCTRHVKKNEIYTGWQKCNIQNNVLQAKLRPAPAYMHAWHGMHTHHTSMHLLIHTQTHTRMHLHVCTRTFTHVHACTQTWIHTSYLMFVCMSACMHARVCMCIGPHCGNTGLFWKRACRVLFADMQ